MAGEKKHGKIRERVKRDESGQFLLDKQMPVKKTDEKTGIYYIQKKK